VKIFEYSFNEFNCSINCRLEIIDRVDEYYPLNPKDGKEDRD
jgi:hypothetical protein